MSLIVFFKLFYNPNVNYLKTSQHLIPDTLWPFFCHWRYDFMQMLKDAIWYGAPEITLHPAVVALAPISVPVCVDCAEFQWEGGCESTADGISSSMDKQEVVSAG